MKKLLVILLLLSGIKSYGQTPAIQVAKAGKGQPVLLLPGFTCPGSVWNETVTGLNSKYETHAVSYAGFNGIAPIKTPWYDQVKTGLVDYIISQKLTGVKIIGHSLGGTLALDLAVALPDKISSLIIVDALPCLRELWMPGVTAEQISYEGPYNKQMLEMNADGFKATANMIAQSMTLKSDKIETIVQWMIDADRETYVYGYTDLLKQDLRESLKQVKVKTLIIGAPFPDKQAVTANFEKQYANLAFKTIVIADNSRHFIMFDQPEWFNQQVRTFLSE